MAVLVEEICLAMRLGLEAVESALRGQRAGVEEAEGFPVPPRDRVPSRSQRRARFFARVSWAPPQPGCAFRRPEARDQRAHPAPGEVRDKGEEHPGPDGAREAVRDEVGPRGCRGFRESGRRLELVSGTARGDAVTAVSARCAREQRRQMSSRSRPPNPGIGGDALAAKHTPLGADYSIGQPDSGETRACVSSLSTRPQYLRGGSRIPVRRHCRDDELRALVGRS